MEYALVDRGANGGICGSDMKVLEGSERFVDVVGLAGHKVSQLRIVTAKALVTTHKGDVIATFHQMALLGKGPVCKWRHMAQISMIVLVSCLEVNSGF
jgi:threonine dehydrogenase-like Zn-dependent dehydrogenase